MSYRIYSTRAFILSSAPSGETSKTYLLYTEDFGLVRAKAQGVRSLASKLRYNLSDYEMINVSLVRGKELWRLTGAEKIASNVESAVANLSAKTSEVKKMRARVLSLIKRLVHGEEKNQELFDSLANMFSEQSLASDSSLSPDLETMTLAKALGSLGYLDTSKLVGADKRQMVLAINKAIQETQL